MHDLRKPPQQVTIRRLHRLAMVALAAAPLALLPAAKASEPGRLALTCVRPSAVQPIGFSMTKYPSIRRHFRRALRRGWPRLLVLNRSGAEARRDRLLDGVPTREGFDRD